MDDDEQPGDIRTKDVAYDLLTDYPTILSTSYTGPRECRGNSFGERDIAMMKERLGISAMENRGNDASGRKKNIDRLAKVVLAFGRELWSCMGAESVKEGKQQDRQGWERALRRLVKVSKFLPPMTKRILSKHSSILEDAVGDTGKVKRRIPIEDEKWDQERRWMWHALELVCQDLATSHRTSIREAEKAVQQHWADSNQDWFMDRGGLHPQDPDAQ